MKTLILNGSPRKNGDSRFIIDALTKALKGEIILINVYDEKVSPCIDCRYCWKENDCAIKDDMSKTYDLMNEVDNVILSSPIYFSELSGPLLSYVSRFQRYYAQKVLRADPNFYMKPKKGLILLSAGDDLSNLERPIKTAKIILGMINTKSLGVIATVQTNEIPAKEDKTLDQKIIDMAKLLNSAE
ncbi:flavodoxin family protein [Fusibacter sp. 3D3]|uniref:flavodoxin family protein n=1 Tax=Fusibacter sp. 3D3 TaxID=1048380 RepID=UPI000853DE95|nr:flavodoxin family protein [Fusibacter sp. 3D3]GAU78438.1 iron-sulfur flavoprotein [Fusibacter sp. 3D3]